MRKTFVSVLVVLVLMFGFAASAMAEEGESYTNVKIMLIPWNEITFEAGGVSGDQAMKFSGGFGFGMDWMLLDYLGLGFEIDYFWIAPDAGSPSWPLDYMSVTNVDFMFKGAYPFKDLNMEVYLKAGAGLGVIAPPKYDGDIELGWNVIINPGFMYRFDSVGIFLEPGFTINGWEGSVAGMGSATALYKSFTLNVGVSFI